MSDTLSPQVLSLGLGAWLQFERACKRTEVLSEAYLAAPIAQLLNAHTSKRVVSEFKHPILAPLAKGSGRRPSIDFVVCDHEDKIYYAIETKWVGKTGQSPKKILWDLMRLSLLKETLLKENLNARCLFVLGGRRKSIRELSEKEGFLDSKRKGWQKPLLRFDKNTRNSVRLDSSDRFRQQMLREIYGKYQDTWFPTKLVTCRATPFLKEPKNQDFEVYIWEVVASDAQFFKPTNNLHFHKDTPEE